MLAHLSKLVGATKQLEQEMPISCLGVVVYFFLKQVWFPTQYTQSMKNYIVS